MEMSNIYREGYNGLKDGRVKDKKTRKNSNICNTLTEWAFDWSFRRMERKKRIKKQILTLSKWENNLCFARMFIVVKKQT